MTTRLTHSAISMFRQCPRRYQHRYIDQIVPEHWRESPALTFGSAVHNALEAWYKGEPLADDKRAVDPDVALLVDAAMGAYQERYPFETWKPVAVEHQFDVPILDPDTGKASATHRLSGKVDLIVEIDGELWVVEHKTSTATESADLERVGIDAQVLSYADGIGIETGHDVTGVIYNVIKRCMLRLKKSETPDEYATRVAEWYRAEGAMLRERCRIDRAMIIQNRRNIWHNIHAMNHAEHTSFYPQNAGVTSGACAKWGRECEYAPLCRTLSRPDIRANYKHQAPHSELELEGE